jgi:cytochrome c oxidase cbb3-type subunit III
MYCIYCHGEEGKGDGPLAESLGEDIYPRDLTDANILSERIDAELFKVIKEGGPAAGFSEAMPAQGGAMLTDEEVKNIILYIRADLCKCEYKGK